MLVYFCRVLWLHVTEHIDCDAPGVLCALLIPKGLMMLLPHPTIWLVCLLLSVKSCRSPSHHTPPGVSDFPSALHTPAPGTPAPAASELLDLQLSHFLPHSKTVAYSFQASWWQPSTTQILLIFFSLLVFFLRLFQLRWGILVILSYFPNSTGRSSWPSAVAVCQPATQSVPRSPFARAHWDPANCAKRHALWPAFTSPQLERCLDSQTYWLKR